MNNKVVRMLFPIFVMSVLFLDSAFPGKGIQVVGLIPVYVIVCMIRNNYWWYFALEILIIVLYLSTYLTEMTEFSDISFLATLIAIIAYFILIVIFNNRGYPFKKKGE